MLNCFTEVNQIKITSKIFLLRNLTIILQKLSKPKSADNRLHLMKTQLHEINTALHVK